MNFMDAYDVSGPSTPREGPEPTLNEEVTQVVGQLSRLWGGFRKQSQTVLESARKDLGQVVAQAQKELTKLTEAPADAPADGAAKDAPAAAPSEAAEAAESSSASKEAGPSVEGSSSSATEEPTTPTASSQTRHARGNSMSATAQGLFNRLQSSLPSNLATTVQAQLPEALRSGGGSIDFAQLRTTLATEFQRVQGVTRAQAEEYVHKSEELLREAGEFLKDAVKVVPPEEGEGTPGVLWDGTDVWMLPEMRSSGDSKGKRREQSADGRSSGESHRAGATRAEALLKQLHHDPEVIRIDPETDERAKEMWAEWLEKEVESEEHGILSERWTAAVQKALSDTEDGDALQKTMEVLVPSAIPSETFWTRYFFRVHQVEVEEERRKALIEGTAESEEDINWESDEDESANSTTDNIASPREADIADSDPTIKLATSRETLTAKKAPATSSSTPATTSPRLSSEGSYDVVSSQVSNAGDPKPGDGKENPDDDDDSDWE